jgi:aryl-alcohol dehydrogenase-like predicted oxidoreductase
MTFGEQGGVGAAPDECRRIVDAYADAGGNVIDTAINYRGGASEEILGDLLRGRRDRFVLATKYTVSRDRDDPNAAGNHRKNLRLSLETSLRRLRTSYIDIYWVHMWDRHTPPEETMRALDDEVRAGKSCMSVSPIRPDGSSPGRTRWPSGTTGQPSPASRCRIACCNATSSVSCCPWPTPWA